jgi:radical S-adenosyl methionine domain-containing protein 2
MQHLLAGEGAVSPEFPALVINWHVTEACNYRCAYCYAYWEAPDRREIIRDRQETERLVRAVYADFAGAPSGGVAGVQAGSKRIRLNFAGGEPLLFAEPVFEAMQIARRLGMDISLITNGSRLTRYLVMELAPLLTTLGVSIDAFERESNAAIGRIDAVGRTPNLGGLADLLTLARRTNPRLTIKTNTVVNAMNWHLDGYSGPS